MLIIGELINGMYKQVGYAIVDKDKKIIQKLALEQIKAGANLLDINVGPVSSNPIDDMKWLVDTIQEVTDAGLSLDSPKPKVIEQALKLTKNKAMINSTTADDEKLNALLPLAKEHKAYLIALTMEKGIPRDRHVRSEMAAKIVSACMEINFDIRDLYIDPIVLPVNVAQSQGLEVLESLREIKLLSDPPPKTSVGLSNVSQGTQNRSLINRTFLVMAITMGLDAAILDPLDKELMDALITSELLLNKYIYCDSFLDASRKK